MSLTQSIRSGTTAVRARLGRGLDLLRPRAAILLYHRVTESGWEPQLLAVDRTNFAEQLQVINELGVPAKLSDLDQALNGRRGGRPPIVVTFDDGYADNLHHAKPLLAQYGVPATVFVSSGHVRSQRELLHDELDKIFLQPGRLPGTLDLTIDGQHFQWELGAVSAYSEDEHRAHRDWNVLRTETPTGRHRVYRAVYDALFPLDSDRRSRCLRELLSWSGANPEARSSRRPLSAAELVELHSGGLVEVGGHTVNHPALSCLTENMQRAEISECKGDLEAMLGAPVTSFAYPYGGHKHYNAASVAVVKDAGYECACANVPGFASWRSDRWQLPRLLVRDWTGAEFRHRLQTWLREALDVARPLRILHAAFADTFPRVILEALACGAPVVATGWGTRKVF